jgi:methionine synthase II (cobalamin-independent)
MLIPTEPIGGIPRPPELIEALAKGNPLDSNMDILYEAAIRDTIERFEATGSPVITESVMRAVMVATVASFRVRYLLLRQTQQRHKEVR